MMAPVKHLIESVSIRACIAARIESSINSAEFINFLYTQATYFLELSLDNAKYYSMTVHIMTVDVQSSIILIRYLRKQHRRDVSFVEKKKYRPRPCAAAKYT